MPKSPHFEVRARAGSKPGNSGFERLIGAAPAMRELFSALERAAASEATILLEGETGTGKEALSEAIHLASPRWRGPFVVVDCASIPAQLMESELFGHERGAFTGAVGSRPGALESAAGGTVFLDEIGELDPDLQPKLLRALEQRQAKRVGSNRYRPLDIRLIAATNRDLRREVAAKRFRSDLFFRLAVVSVRIPPLRERIEDLPALLEYMLKSLGAPAPLAGLLRDPTFLTEMAGYPWPGNVRELRNHIERCVAMGHLCAPAGGLDNHEASSHAADTVTIDGHLPIAEAREAFDRLYLQTLMQRHEGSIVAAAHAAALARPQLQKLLAKHGLAQPRKLPRR